MKNLKKQNRWIFEGNKKFQNRKCAYFLPKERGRGSYKPFSIFSNTPFGGLANTHF
jgi:hypothetical protein